MLLPLGFLRRDIDQVTAVRPVERVPPAGAAVVGRALAGAPQLQGNVEFACPCQGLQQVQSAVLVQAVAPVAVPLRNLHACPPAGRYGERIAEGRQQRADARDLRPDLVDAATGLHGG